MKLREGRLFFQSLSLSNCYTHTGLFLSGLLYFSSVLHKLTLIVTKTPFPDNQNKTTEHSYYKQYYIIPKIIIHFVFLPIPDIL